MFWHKTLGHLNVIQLFDAFINKDEIKQLYINTNKLCDIRERLSKITSLCNLPNALQGDPLFFPFVYDGTTELNLLMIPKLISNFLVPIPSSIINITSESERRKIALKYSVIENVKRITTLSEPFLTSVVEHVFCSLKGYGVPDFPDLLQKSLAIKLKEVFKNDI